MSIMVHDQTASVVQLARSILFGMDRSRLETGVQTQTLILLLNTLIELGEPSVVQKVQDGATRAILGHVTEVTAAVAAAEDAWAKERDAEASMMEQGRGR